MSTRKKEKKGATQQTGVNDYTGAFKSYDITPEEQELKEWAPARVASRSVDLPHKYVYVQQPTASKPTASKPTASKPTASKPTASKLTDTVQKISVYLI